MSYASAASSLSYSSVLKLCLQVRNQHFLKKLHAVAIKIVELSSDTFFSNTLVSSYSKLGLIDDARKLFDKIPHPNSYSWNIVLSAYSKAGRVPEMEDIFWLMPERDCVSWTCFISGLAGHCSTERAVRAYRAMLREGCNVPSRVTFSTMVILSSKCMSSQLGFQVHCQIIKYGFESNAFVGSPLVDMYAKAGLFSEARMAFDSIFDKNVVTYNTMMMGLLRCGMVEGAKQLFGEMIERDSISWTTMVTGLAQNGLELDALQFFRRMRTECVPIDQYTFGSALTACGALVALEQGKQIHSYAIRTHYDDIVFVGSALVDTYCKCRSIKLAEAVFRRMPTRNVVSWTALLVGYGQNGWSEEAVRIFSEMQRNGIKPDEFTLGSVISSCANLATLEEGAQFHCQALVSGLISFMTVSNAIVTLYGKCGSIEDSHRLFNEMHSRDQVSWSALISGYARYGKAKETIDLFEEMLASGVQPDGVTFIGIISACSRAGLVEKGRQHYDSMIKEHGIVPTDDHYTCMIDLLSRAGRLKEAEDFIKLMPCRPDSIAWATLLSSCRFHNNTVIGKWAAENLLELEPQNPASYILLSSIHAADGNWTEVAELRRNMREQKVRKEPGCSWIKYKNVVHIFSAGDQSHPYSERIYAELETLNDKMIEEGYKPDTSSVLHDVTDSEKTRMLSHHSERLAIAFGLIFVPKELPIKVVKNLRVCVDCHTATKYISKICGREILVRDAVRFHKFSGGVCSCGDFW